MAMETKHEG